MRRAPSHETALLTEALKGERVTIYDISEDGWAWGQLAGDGYVGYMPATTLGASGPAATHKVSALRTFVYPGPSIKLSPAETLSFGCHLAVARTEGPFAIIAAGGHVPLLHLAPMETVDTDFVEVAERFLGTPYLWGGKTSLGVDCSGLVQLALAACGIHCPRDTDMQEQALAARSRTRTNSISCAAATFCSGRAMSPSCGTKRRWCMPTPRHMAVASESTAAVIARIRAAGSEVTSVRRLPPPS